MKNWWFICFNYCFIQFKWKWWKDFVVWWKCINTVIPREIFVIVLCAPPVPSSGNIGTWHRQRLSLEQIDSCSGPCVNACDTKHCFHWLRYVYKYMHWAVNIDSVCLYSTTETNRYLRCLWLQRKNLCNYRKMWNQFEIFAFWLMWTMERRRWPIRWLQATVIYCVCESLTENRN